MDLRTTYMGMELKHPIVASASPLMESVDNMKRMEDAGAAAVIMFSLFEEQLKHEAAAMDHLMHYGENSFAESLSFFPDMEEDFKVGSEQYLDILHKASESLEIPVMGSLNGITDEGWTEYASKMAQAGASAIELNIYHIPTDLYETGNKVETQYLDILKAVKSAVDVPVALKLSPFFSSTGSMARRFDEAGADALVLFNRFYQPDIDLEALEVSSTLQLSSPYEIRLPLMWIGILYGRIKASLAATRGVHSAKEVVKYIMAGADVVMTTSALLQHGIGYLEALVEDLQDWMESKEYDSVQQMKGSMSQKNVANPGAFERANYIKMLESYKSVYSR